MMDRWAADSCGHSDTEVLSVKQEAHNLEDIKKYVLSGIYAALTLCASAYDLSVMSLSAKMLCTSLY